MSEFTTRAAIKREAEFWITNQTLTHYVESRPIPLKLIKAHRQNNTDCSGWIIGVYFSAGAPDPSGNGYDGAGFTGSFLDHCQHVKQTELQVGDIVEFGGLDAKAHASLVIQAGDDPMMASNGFDGGPIPISLSAEIAQRRAGGFPVKPISFLSVFTPHSRPKAKRFVVYRDGKVIAHTNHWKAWANTHRPFRHAGGNLRFHDRREG